MSAAVLGTENGSQEWVSVTEAAHLSRVSERTVQRWIENQRVVSDMSDDGRRRVRRSSLPPACLLSDMSPPADGHLSDTMGPLSDRLTDSMSDTLECPTVNDTTHGLSDNAATLRAESDEREKELLRQQVDTLTADVSFLRGQLEQRGQAEEQLRVMLARLEATNAQLAGALVQKALPPATITQPETPKKARWWFFGRR